MILRPAQPQDVPAMRMLERQADLTAHWSAREYDALFDRNAPKRIALVAETETPPSNLQGFLIARCDWEEWELENIVVAADRQRLGVGSALIRELLQRAESAGATSVLLEVRASNFAGSAALSEARISRGREARGVLSASHGGRSTFAPQGCRIVTKYLEAPNSVC